ncbi:MAG: hypothetical protein CVU08_09695 [Bacteroidetes bacterium HGW-Bacteroidetes-3]|jgi:hypothetical protein|nr:MAG: hypothetical protein CVU08_09695 [Bacteroidetes bacterium HGW-Bacteroidetes-3]
MRIINFKAIWNDKHPHFYLYGVDCYQDFNKNRNNLLALESNENEKSLKIQFKFLGFFGRGGRTNFNSVFRYISSI